MVFVDNVEKILLASKNWSSGKESREIDMSFLLAAPELIRGAAQDLAGIRSSVAEATARSLGACGIGEFADERPSGHQGAFGIQPVPDLQQFINNQIAYAQIITTSLSVGLGLPQLLAFDALGAPVNAAIAASASGRAFFDTVLTGDPRAAFAAFIDAPANIANAFLNGERTLPLTLPVPGLSVPADVRFAGLLVPLQPFTATAPAAR